jgi:hypothetical protein
MYLSMYICIIYTSNMHILIFINSSSCRVAPSNILHFINIQRWQDCVFAVTYFSIYKHIYTYIPGGPGSPIGPKRPGRPTSPVIPLSPWRPCGPVAPLLPVNPLKPLSPVPPWVSEFPVIPLHTLQTYPLYLPPYPPAYPPIPVPLFACLRALSLRYLSDSCVRCNVDI